MWVHGCARRCPVPSDARQRVKAILAGYPLDTIRPATTGEDLWWEKAMVWTRIADRTGWTPDQIDALPWRYRDRVMSCFGLLDEVRAERRPTQAMLAPEALPQP